MKNNTVDQEQEVRDYLLAAGIQLSEREVELLKRCTDYTQRLIDGGGSSWPVGVPLIRTQTGKPAVKSFDDIAATVWKKRNSFTPINRRRT